MRILRAVPPVLHATPRGGYSPSDMQSVWKWSLAFQCVVNIGVRGSEAVRTRVVEAGAIAIAVRVLQSHLLHLEATREAARAANAQSSSTAVPAASTRSTRAEAAFDAALAATSAATNTHATATATATTATTTTTPTAATPTPASLILPSHAQESAQPVQSDQPERPTSTASASNASGSEPEHDADVEMNEVESSSAPAASSNTATSAQQAQSPVDAQATPRPPAPRNLASIQLQGHQFPPQPHDTINSSRRTRTMTPSASGGTVTGTSTAVRGPPTTIQPGPEPFAQPKPGDMLYREEEVLLALQLLAYVSKYAHVRSLFYSDECFAGRFPRRLESYQRLQMHSQHYPLVAPTGKDGKSLVQTDTSPTERTPAPDDAVQGPTIVEGADDGETAPPVPEATTTAGPAAAAETVAEQAIPTVPGVAGYYGFAAPLPGPVGVVGPTEEEKAGGAPLVEITGPRWSNPPSTPTNVFSIAERFTIRSSRSPPISNGRLGREIQFWAGVIMRNACRKDDERGGVRPCAYMQCGKWESFPRQFAKCRRCRKAKYCSKQCQSSGWGSGHRFWCSARPEDEARRDAHSHSTPADAMSTTIPPPPMAGTAGTITAAPPAPAQALLPPATTAAPAPATGAVPAPAHAAPAETEETHRFRLPGHLTRPPPGGLDFGAPDLTPRQRQAAVGGLTATRHTTPPGTLPPAPPATLTVTMEGEPEAEAEAGVGAGTGTATAAAEPEVEPARAEAIDQLRTTLRETASGTRSRSRSGSQGRRADRQPAVNPRLLAVRQALTSTPSTAEGSEASDEEAPSVRRGLRTPRPASGAPLARAARAEPEEASFNLLSGAETDASMDVDNEVEAEPQATAAESAHAPAHAGPMRTHLLVAPAVRRTDMSGRPLPPPLIASLDADPMQGLPPRAGTPGAVLRHMPHPTPGAPAAPTGDFDPQPQDNPFVDPDRELENMPWDAIEGYRLDTTPTSRREALGEGSSAAPVPDTSMGPSRPTAPRAVPRIPQARGASGTDASPGAGASFPPTSSALPRRAQDDATLPPVRRLPRPRAASPSFLPPAGGMQGYMPSPLGPGSPRAAAAGVAPGTATAPSTTPTNEDEEEL